MNITFIILLKIEFTINFVEKFKWFTNHLTKLFTSFYIFGELRAEQNILLAVIV